MKRQSDMDTSVSNKTINLLVSGQPRLFRQNFGSLKKLVEPFDQANIFAHFWLNNQAECEQIKEQLATISRPLVRAFVEWSPTRTEAIICDDYAIHSARVIPLHVPRALSQYQSLKNAWLLASVQLPADEINKGNFVRYRTDLLVDACLPPQAPKGIQIPGLRFSVGINDFCAYGNGSSMSVYANAFDSFRTLYQLGFYLPPEIVLSFHLAKYDASVVVNQSLPQFLLATDNNGKLVIRIKGSRAYGHSYVAEFWHGYLDCFDLKKSRPLRLVSEIQSRFKGALRARGSAARTLENLNTKVR